LVALPIVQEQSQRDPLFIFKQWLARMLIFRPIPSLIRGDSTKETLEPNLQVTDFGSWFSGLLAYTPAAYARIDESLQQVMPDLKGIQNAGDWQGLSKSPRPIRPSHVRVCSNIANRGCAFGGLSDGEKCFMICAVVLAASDAYGPLLCFWDEPDSHLAPSEVGHFVLALRKAFQSGGQFIMTSHNAEAIRRFSDENTIVLGRRSHLEPMVARTLGDVKINGDLVGALIRGEVEV
jgi:hypothetical protein